MRTHAFEKKKINYFQAVFFRAKHYEILTCSHACLCVCVCVERERDR